MSTRLDIRVRCIAVPAKLRNEGVRAFAQAVINDNLVIDGLVCRRTQAGGHQVTWPTRFDANRRPHQIVTLLDTAARQAVESAVLAEAERGGWITP